MIRVPRTARSAGGFRRYREDCTQIVGGTLDAECMKICAREHEEPNSGAGRYLPKKDLPKRGLPKEQSAAGQATDAVIHLGGMEAPALKGQGGHGRYGFS